MVFVAVIVLLVAAALPAIVVAQVMHPRRLTRGTRAVRTVATVPMAALPMLWACVAFVFLLSPECFVVPAFGYDVDWESYGGISFLGPHSGGATPSICTTPSSIGVVQSESCGPLTFDRVDHHDGAYIETLWSLSRQSRSSVGEWYCHSTNPRSGPGPHELIVWTSANRSLVTYECRATDPRYANVGSIFNSGTFLQLRAVEVPRGPGDNLPLMVALAVATLALTVSAVVALQGADRRSRLRLYKFDVPFADDAPDPGERHEEVEVGLTPFRTARLTKPAPPPHRSPRRAAFERRVRRRWIVVAALFAAGLVASIAALTHHGHVPGRPLVTTRPFFDATR